MLYSWYIIIYVYNVIVRIKESKIKINYNKCEIIGINFHIENYHKLIIKHSSVNN